MVAAADLVRDRAEGLCSRFGGVPTTAWKDVLASDADIVVIATTHDQLALLALEAVKAGKHVLLEKPGARCAAELEPVARVATEQGLKVKVGFNHRFHPSLLKARQIVDAGKLGPLMFVRGRYGHGGPIGVRQGMALQRRHFGRGRITGSGFAPH